MTREEKLALLRQWEASYLELDLRPITQAADLLWLIEGGGGDKEAAWAEA